MMEYMISSGIRAEMEIARLTAICRKTDCGPLENEVVRLRAQIRALEQEGNGAQIKVGMCATKFQFLELRLLSSSNWNLATPATCGVYWGHRGSGEIPLWPSRAKKSRKEQPVAPPNAPPYKEVTSGRKQELDQEATPGRFVQNPSCSCCSP